MKTIKLPVKTFKIKWVDKEQRVQSRLSVKFMLEEKLTLLPRRPP